MTPEDKTWLYIGAGLAVTGAAVYWYKNKKDNTTKAFDAPINEIDAPTNTATPPLVGNGTVKPKPAKTVKSVSGSKPIPDIKKATFMYVKGQENMFNTRNGVTVYDVQKKADGTYFSNGVAVQKFGFGKLIGTVVTAQRKESGILFYIVKGFRVGGSENFDNTYMYVEHSKIKGIAPILKPINLENVPTLDRNKILKKGVKGAEVTQLQKLLKIEQDGDFGPKTEAALVSKKQITSISLSSF